MVQRKATVYRKPAARQTCRHYWVIENPAGRTSRGVCKLCGAQREFRNYLRDCIGVDEEDYKAWLRGPEYEKEEKKPEGDILSRLRGGDKDAVKAGI